MLVYCWASVIDSGPTLNKHWINVSRVSGIVTGLPSTQWGASVTERLRARPQAARARISNPMCLEGSVISLISPSSGGSPGHVSLYVHSL